MYFHKVALYLDFVIPNINVFVRVLKLMYQSTNSQGFMCPINP